MKFKELFELLNEEEGRVVKDAFGYRFDVYCNEGFSEEPHIHFYSKQTGNKGALSLIEAGYYDHGECNGRLEKEPYRYIVSKLRDNSKFKEVCKEWNKTISYKKFIGEIINPYNKNKIII